MKLFEKFFVRNHTQPVPTFSIRTLKENDHERICSKIVENWGSTLIVSKGKSRDVLGIEGFIAEVDSHLGGYVFYEIANGDCEIVLLDSFRRRIGIGTTLVLQVLELAKSRGLNRVFVVTTNDNTYALQFYQKLGFDLAALHKRAILKKKKLKPEISLKGYHGIPVRHEIELERVLDKTSQTLKEEEL